MNYAEFRELKHQLNALSKPKINLIKVQSRREISALFEHVEEKANSSAASVTSPFSQLQGIPIVYDEEIPEGILRLMLDDKVVQDILIR